MVWVDNISDLEYFHANPAVWAECYGDVVFEPSDIILQAQLGTSFDLTSISLPTINILKTDGTFVETGNAYFHLRILSFYLNGVTYYYANAQCHDISPGMAANGCFCIEFIVDNALAQFHKYTQKFQLNDPAFILPSGITITTPGTGNLATLCVVPEQSNSCRKPFVKLVSFCDCIDSFSGDFFGDGSLIVENTATPFTYARLSWIQGRIKVIPDAIKRTISINNRTQKTERTAKTLLQGEIPFPQWKMEEIEAMLLQNHLFVNDVEKQSEGGTPFTQLGVPQSCVYAYKLELSLQDPYEWQIFGCTPPCEPATYYYPVTF